MDIPLTTPVLENKLLFCVFVVENASQDNGRSKAGPREEESDSEKQE